MRTSSRNFLNRRVARPAQAHKILQRVGFTVLANPKETERLDVVDIKGAAQFVLTDSAELAHVTVSPSGVARLANPVGSVVVRVPTEPCRVSVAAPVLRFPRPKAGVVAERHLSFLARAPWRTRDRSPAIRAGLCDAPSETRMRVAHEAAYVRSGHALARAIVDQPLSVANGAMKFGAALRANKRLALPRVPALRDVDTVANASGPRVDVGASGGWVFVRHSPLYGERMGIGSEGFVALELGRKFVGVELKKSYYEQAVRNLEAATKESAQDLFAAEA